MASILNFLYALVIFGIIVFAHEMGHYLAGRALGIAIAEFSIGFGPKLIGFRRGLTYYAIRLIPLGGYCNFIGEDEPERFQAVPCVASLTPESDAAMSGLMPGDVITMIGGRTVAFGPDGVDLITLMVNAGAGAPVTLRVLRGGATLTLSVRPSLTDGEWRLGATLGKVDFGAVPRVVHVDASAQRAGLMPGDVLVKINGKAVLYDAGGCQRIEKVIERAVTGSSVTLSIERAGKPMSVSVPVDQNEPRCGFLMGEAAFPQPGDAALPTRAPINAQPVWKRVITFASGPMMNFVLAYVAAVVYFAFIGLVANIPHVATVMPGLNAEQAGMRAGDVIVEVQGQPIADTPEGASRLLSLIAESAPDAAIDFTVDRDGERLAFAIAPTETDQGRLIGITIDNAVYRVPLGLSFRMGYDAVLNASNFIIVTLRTMFTTGEGLDQAAGPVGVLSIMTKSVEDGFGMVLNMIVTISINLGLMNLLPLPALDGGRLVLAFIEGIRRKPLKPEREGMIHMIGFIAIMGLFLVITYNDIVRLITGG